MVIKKLEQIPSLELEDYTNVTKQVVIGPDDGSNEIVLRYFSLGPGGISPHHSHDFPHLVKIEKGTGVGVDETGYEQQVQAGDYVYVNDNEVHHFENRGSEPFEFICIVPRRGEG
jgi:quercetin dioxygenase-like cupin family protein